MMTTRLMLVLLAVSLNRVVPFIPAHHYFDPFPFHDILYHGINVGISWQSYAYFVSQHLSIILLMLFVSLSLVEYGRLFYYFMVIEIFSLVDFLVIYENAWFSIGDYGVQFTDVKILSYAYLIVRWTIQK